MKNFLLAIMLAISLSGCVGFTFSRNADPVVTTYDTQTKSYPVITTNNFQLNAKHSDRAQKPDKVEPDGSAVYILQDERTWCGLTVWAVIIPLPLWLPACHNRMVVTDKVGGETLVSQQKPIIFQAWCGPFLPFLGLDGGPHGFCRLCDGC